MKESLLSDAMDLFKGNNPKLKEGTKKFNKAIEESFSEYVRYVAQGEENEFGGRIPYVTKFSGGNRVPSELDDGKALLFNSSNTLITSEARQLVEDVKAGKTKLSVDVQKEKTAKRDVSAFERGA